MPTGVTAAFSQNPTTGASTLTLTVGGSVTPGNYPLTVTGSSGGFSHTADPSLTLTVVGKLAINPASLLISETKTRQFTASLGGSSASNVNWSAAFGAFLSPSNPGLYSAPLVAVKAEPVPLQDTITVVTDTPVHQEATATVTVVPLPQILRFYGEGHYPTTRHEAWFFCTFSGGTGFLSGPEAAFPNGPIAVSSIPYGSTTPSIRFSIPNDGVTPFGLYVLQVRNEAGDFVEASCYLVLYDDGPH